MSAILKVFLAFSDKHLSISVAFCIILLTIMSPESIRYSDSVKNRLDYPKINVQFVRVYIIPIHYFTYWRSASPTTNNKIWMATGNNYLSVRKFLGM